jgi:hypothetical protein
MKREQTLAPVMLYFILLSIALSLWLETRL